MPISPIVPFLQYGYREERTTNDGHSVGRCPFCEKDGHFFINTTSDNKTWDCKRCGRSGGFKKFLEQMVEFARGNFHDEPATKLARSRGLLEETLRDALIGYLPLTGAYTLPVYSAASRTPMNVKLYNFKSFQNTAGCSAAMYGLWRIDSKKNYDTVYIAEGEWDALAVTECVKKCSLKTSIVIGAPGAGTFKPDVLQYCAGRRVYVLYDNDLAGRNGAEKACAMVSGVAREVLRLEWDEGAPDGYDVRDVYVKDCANDAQKAMDKIHAACTKYAGGSGQTIQDLEARLPVVPAEEVYRTYRKWLHLPDTTILDVIFGTVIANRLPGDPLWMFVVAPPGATKTEPLMSLTGGMGIETISSLTAHTLISGANFGGGDPSLVPRLNGKVLVIKDFTSILGLPLVERDEIFSILRDAYDGECSKPFGNGVFRRYKSRFGILAAVTPAIELYTEEHAQLGERFLRWRAALPDDVAGRHDYIKRAFDNATKEEEMREELNVVAKRVLAGAYGAQPRVPLRMQHRLICLSQFIATLRATVVRDKYTREVTHRSSIELGTRLAKQLYKLVIGVSMFRGEQEVSEGTFDVAAQVAKSTISARYYDTVKVMYVLKKAKTVDVSRFIKLPGVTTKTVLENLYMLGVLRKEQEGSATLWVLQFDFYQIMRRCALYDKGLTQYLLEVLDVDEADAEGRKWAGDTGGASGGTEGVAGEPAEERCGGTKARGAFTRKRPGDADRSVA